jgi:hypothetical protein
LPLAAQGSIMLLGAENNGAFAVFIRRYLNHEFEQTVINLSLGIVVGAIIVAVILSLIFPHKHKLYDDESD